MAKAYVLIVNETGKDDSVISDLRGIPSITDACGTFGTFDILTKLESSDEDAIQRDISYRLRKIPDIRSTLTLLVDKKSGIHKTTKDEQQVLEKHMAQAYVIIHCLKSNEKIILEKLNKIPEVIEADLLIGTYEILCKVVAPTYNDISEIISKNIRKISEIKSTITINVINNQRFSR